MTENSPSVIVHRVVLPTGNIYTLYASKEQDKSELVQRLILNYWGDYIERNWLEGDGEYGSGEQRVKRMLDSCGYFLLRSDTSGITTDRKSNSDKSREVLISACPEILLDAMYSTAKHGEIYDDTGGYDIINITGSPIGDIAVLGKPNKKYNKPQESLVFNKLFKLRNAQPNFKMSWCRVDTNNEFTYKDVRYVISKELAVYNGVDTSEGVYYATDKILVADDSVWYEDRAPILKFYDPNIVEILRDSILEVFLN